MDPFDDLRYRAYEAWFDRTIDKMDRDFVTDMRAEKGKWEADMNRKIKTRFADTERKVRQKIIGGGSVQSAPESEPQLRMTPLNEDTLQQAETIGVTSLVDHAVQTDSLTSNRIDEMEDTPVNNDLISTGTNVSHALELPTVTPNERHLQRLSSTTINTIIDDAVKRGMRTLTDITENRNQTTFPLNNESGTCQRNLQIHEPCVSTIAYTADTDNTTTSTTESMHILNEQPTETENLPQFNGGTVGSLVESESDVETSRVFDDNSDFVTDPSLSQLTREQRLSTDGAQGNHTSDGLDGQSENSLSEATTEVQKIESQHSVALDEESQINNLHYDSCDDKSSYDINTSISESNHTSVSITFASNKLEMGSVTSAKKTQKQSIFETSGKEPDTQSDRKTLGSASIEKEQVSKVNRHSEISLKVSSVNSKPQEDHPDQPEKRITINTRNESKILQNGRTIKELKARALFTSGSRPGNTFHPGGSSHSQKSSRIDLQRKQQNTRDVYRAEDHNTNILDLSFSDDTSRGSQKSITYYASNLWSSDSESTVKRNFPRLGNSETRFSPTFKANVPDLANYSNKDISQSKINLEVMKNEVIMEAKKKLEGSKQEFRNETEMQLQDMRDNVAKEIKEIEKKLRKEDEGCIKSEAKSRREQETLVFERVMIQLEEYMDKLKRDLRGIKSDKTLKSENEKIEVHCQTVNCHHVTINNPCQLMPAPTVNKLHTKTTFHQTPEQFLADQTSDVEFQSESSTSRTFVSPKSPRFSMSSMQDQDRIQSARLVRTSSQSRFLDQTRPYNMNLDIQEVGKKSVPSHAYTQQDAGTKSSNQINTDAKDKKFRINHPHEMKHKDDTGIKIQKLKHLLKFKKRKHKYTVKSENEEHINPSMNRPKRPNIKQVKTNKTEFSDIFQEEEDSVLSYESEKSESLSAQIMYDDSTLNESRNSSEDFQQNTLLSDVCTDAHRTQIPAEYGSMAENNKSKEQAVKHQNVGKKEVNSTKSTNVLKSEGKPGKSRKCFKTSTENEISVDQTNKTRMLQSQQIRDIKYKDGSCKEKTDMKVKNKSYISGSSTTEEKREKNTKHLVERKPEQSPTSPYESNKLLGRKCHQTHPDDIKEESIIQSEVSDRTIDEDENEKFEESDLDEMSTETVLTSSAVNTDRDIKFSSQTPVKSGTELQTAIDTELIDNTSVDKLRQSLTNIVTEKENSIARDVKDTKHTSRGKQRVKCLGKESQETGQQYSNSNIKLDPDREKEKVKMHYQEDKRRYPISISDSEETSIVDMHIKLENERAVVSRIANKITSKTSEIVRGQSDAKVSDGSCTNESGITQFSKQDKKTTKPSSESRKKKVIHVSETKSHQQNTSKALEDYISSDTNSSTADSPRSSIHEEVFDRASTLQYSDGREKKSKRKRKPIRMRENVSDTEESDIERKVQEIYHKNTDRNVLLQSAVKEANQQNEIYESDHVFERSTYDKCEQEKQIQKKKVKSHRKKVKPVLERQSDPDTLSILDTDKNTEELKDKKSETKPKRLSNRLPNKNLDEPSDSSTSLGNLQAGKYTESIRKTKRKTRNNEGASNTTLEHEDVEDRISKDESIDQNLREEYEFKRQTKIYNLSENEEETQCKAEENLSDKSTSSGSVKHLSYESDEHRDLSDCSRCMSQDKFEDERKIKKRKTIKSDVQDDINANITAEKEDICCRQPTDIPEHCPDLSGEDDEKSQYESTDIASMLETQTNTSGDEISCEGISDALLSENVDNIKEQFDDYNECTLSDVSASRDKDMKRKSNFPFKLRLRKAKKKTNKKERDAKREEKQRQKELKALEKEIEKEKKELKKIDKEYERKERKLLKKEEKSVLKDLKEEFKAERKLGKMQLKKEKATESKKKKEAKKAEKNEKKEEKKLQSEAKKAEKALEKKEKKLEKLQRNEQKKVEKRLSQAEKKEEKREKKLEKLKKKLEHKEQSKEAKLNKKKEKEAMKLESQKMKHEKKLKGMREKALKRLEKDEKKWQKTEENVTRKEEMKQIKKERKLEKERWKLIEKRDRFVLKKEQTKKKEELKRQKKELIQKAKRGMLNDKLVVTNKCQTERKSVTAKEMEKNTSTKTDGENQYSDVMNTDIYGMDTASISNESDSLNNVLENIFVENTHEDEVQMFQNIYSIDDKETDDTFYQQKQEEKGRKLSLVKEMEKRSIRVIETESVNENGARCVTNNKETVDTDYQQKQQKRESKLNLIKEMKKRNIRVIETDSIKESDAKCVQNNVGITKTDNSDQSRMIQKEQDYKENSVVKQVTINSARETPNMEYTAKESKETDIAVKQKTVKSPREPPQLKSNGKREEPKFEPNYNSWEKESSDEKVETFKPKQPINVTGTQKKSFSTPHTEVKLNSTSTTKYSGDRDTKEKTVEFISEGGYNSWDESEKEDVFAKTSFRFQWDERESKEVEFVQEDGYNSWDDSEKEEDALECEIREVMGDNLDAYESTKPAQVKEEKDILDDPILEKLYGNKYEEVCGKKVNNSK